MDGNHSELQHVTIRDVARLAGVSIKTVSRVINDMPHVREQTRLRVQAAVDKLNFSPNLVARKLGSMRKKSVVPQTPAIAKTNVSNVSSSGREIDWW